MIVIIYIFVSIDPKGNGSLCHLFNFGILFPVRCSIASLFLLKQPNVCDTYAVMPLL